MCVCVWSITLLSPLSDLLGYLDGESTSRVERRFLGSFVVPFATVYKEGRVEGIYRMNTPFINIGYEHYRSPDDRSDDDGSKFFTYDDPKLNAAAGSCRHIRAFTHSSIRTFGLSSTYSVFEASYVVF